MKKIYVFPQKHLLLSIPTILLLGFITGAFVDTSVLKSTILFATVLMIYSTMVGFKLKELTSLSETKVLFVALAINFIAIPLIAYVLGITVLKEYPLMFAGLALAAVLPTSGMTISWTAIYKGNMSAAIKLTVFGLIIGSLVAPWYLLLMVGEYVEVNVWGTFKTIALVVFLPLILGKITHMLLLKKYTPQAFQNKVKPNFPPLSIWAMLYVVFVSISMKAEMILANLQLIVIAVVVLVLFYAVSFLLSTILARLFFNREDGIALVNGTVLRNLSIAIGLAATSFGGEAALLVTIGFVIQQQSIVLYGKLAKNRWFKEKNTIEKTTTLK
nr:bile acid:sodium symporter [Paraliobacillus sp. PM-2]